MAQPSVWSTMEPEKAQQLIDQLIVANEKANENAKRLLDALEVRRAAENELASRIAVLFGSKEEHSPFEKEFLEWFKKVYYPDDEDDKMGDLLRARREEMEREERSRRHAEYVRDDTVDEGLLGKLVETLRTLTNAPTSAAAPLADLAALEKRVGFCLPGHVTKLMELVFCGDTTNTANPTKKKRASSAPRDGENPLQSLLPYRHMGLYCMLHSDSAEEDDEPIVKAVLAALRADHEFDDEYCMASLCGYEKASELGGKQQKVLLVSAPSQTKRVFLNIRVDGEGAIRGDGLFYLMEVDEDEDSSCIKQIGTAEDWLLACIVRELQAGRSKHRLAYPWMDGAEIITTALVRKNVGSPHLTCV